LDQKKNVYKKITIPKTVLWSLK